LSRRKVSAVIFDLDGTLTTTPSPWRHVHERLGVWDNMACSFFEEWLAGRISYDEFCHRDARLWDGHTVHEIEQLLDEIDFNRHVPDVVSRLVRDGIPSIIISSGFRYVAAKIQTQCGWRPLTIYANELVEGPHVKINVSGDFSSPLSKRSLAAGALQHLNATFDDTLVVSDTTRDLEALSECRFKLLIETEDDLIKVHNFLG
jgi:HAD superfamily phosphoserine phosphatase-like hydrolase